MFFPQILCQNSELMLLSVSFGSQGKPSFQSARVACKLSKLLCKWEDQRKLNKESNGEKQDDQLRVSALDGTNSYHLWASDQDALYTTKIKISTVRSSSMSCKINL